MASPKLKKTSVNPNFYGVNDDARAAVRATRFASQSRPRHTSPRSSSSPSRLTTLKGSPPITALDGIYEKRSASIATTETPSPTYSAPKQPWTHSSKDMQHKAGRKDLFVSGYQMGISKPEKEKSSKNKAHIRTHLKRSTQSNSIDLDRSALENEGLGIYTNLERDRRYGDNATSRRNGSGSHHRSTSGTSQFSSATSASLHKPGGQYVHPKRQTPRPYTPPISHSYQNSVIGSEYSDAGKFSTELNDATSVHQDLFPPASLGSNPETRHPYLIQSSSLTNIPSSASHNHTLESVSILETVSPISRSSLDFSFRSRTRTNTDPPDRVAAVQAARQAFEDKEAAKARKLEKQNMKAQDRQLRRMERKEPHVGSKSSSPEAGLNEKTSPQEGTRFGRRSFNEKSDSDSPRASTNKRKPSHTIENPKSAWVLFITWLRTKLFKIGRKLKKPS
ncbi:hypothetical protein FQN55_006328 [Onygenales sp. PD_40]|nr:hypothetical protein FQN55_006328 [Onygenales sp. PD_40]